MVSFVRLAAAATLAAGLFAGAAQAAPQLKLDNVDAWGAGSSGGPFAVTTTGLPAGNGSFLTFCIERSEFLSNGGTYDISLSGEAKYNGSYPNTDPLSSKTAYLYTAFRNGTLDDKASAAGFAWAYGNADGGTDTDGAALQDAIWYLENELGSVSALAQKLVGLTSGVAENSGLGNVRVINMWTLNTLPRMEQANSHQDLLILVPTPEALVGGLGLLGVLGAARLRRRSSAL